MATHDEHQRIAAAVHAIRPEWNPVSLTTYLDRHHYHRPYTDLTVAAIAVALDRTTRTPKLLEHHGRWWDAAYTAAGTSRPTPLPPRTLPCHHDGHTGTDMDCRDCDAMPPPDPDEIARIRAEMRNR